MDVYGPDLFRVDDLLDFSNDDLFSPNSSSITTTTDSDNLLLHHHYHQHPISDNTSSSTTSTTITNDSFFNVPSNNPDFLSTDDLTIPNDDVAELEWLSNFVDDSLTEFPGNPFVGTANLSSDTSFQCRSRTKRSRSSTINPTTRRESGSVSTDGDPPFAVDLPRRCTHCASEKTPQWRTGPLGPKTLCNACGVRYKSGRLVPEYRPAASPTFVLTQHSNSHRKVLELRRQKDLLRQQQQQQMQIQQQQEKQMKGLHHFQVC